MTDWGNPAGEPPRHVEAVDPNAQQPPPYGYPPYAEQPGAQQPYPTQPYALQPYSPQSYGPYPPQPYAPYPPQPWGYPPAYPSTTDARPGTGIAAAVLGYVNGGLLVLAGALLLFGASVVNDIENAAKSGTDYGGEIAVDGLLNLVAAGLLIAGAVMLTGRNPVGRVMYTVGAAIVLAEAVYWLVRFNDLRGSGFVVWSVLFIALTVVGLALTWTPDMNRWMSTRT